MAPFYVKNPEFVRFPPATRIKIAKPVITLLTSHKKCTLNPMHPLAKKNDDAGKATGEECRYGVKDAGMMVCTPKDVALKLD